jgi:hypothetical protein
MNASARVESDGAVAAELHSYSHSGPASRSLTEVPNANFVLNLGLVDHNRNRRLVASYSVDAVVFPKHP